ncbi:MAG: hypothetical protein QNJ04_03680 [Desulfobacterales bacterium]|nr:hypothetical protein [Desulfobacterales bacterium]
MKRLAIVMVAMVFALVTADAAMAGRAKNRQVNQQKRIHQGVQSGELTKREARRLQKEQRHINRAKKRALSDGELTRKERIRLEKKQDRASRHIYRGKHNDRNQTP